MGATTPGEIGKMKIFSDPIMETSGDVCAPFSPLREAYVPVRPCAFLPRFLFWLSWALAGGLALLVFLCPLLDSDVLPRHGWHKLIAVFARDVALRRTALASALGLAATACVFFQARAPRRAAVTQPKPTPMKVIGA